MNNLQNSAELRTLSCVWILTGNARQPLACRWIAEEVPLLEPPYTTVEKNEPQGERRWLCA